VVVVLWVILSAQRERRWKRRRLSGDFRPASCAALSPVCRWDFWRDSIPAL